MKWSIRSRYWAGGNAMSIDFRVKPYGACSFYIGDTHPFSRCLRILDQIVPKIDTTTTAPAIYILNIFSNEALDFK